MHSPQTTEIWLPYNKILLLANLCRFSGGFKLVYWMNPQYSSPYLTGRITRFTHESKCNSSPMSLYVFLPPHGQWSCRCIYLVAPLILALTSPPTPCPVLYWISGLKCNDENFTYQNAEAFREAAARGIILVEYVFLVLQKYLLYLYFCDVLYAGSRWCPIRRLVQLAFQMKLQASSWAPVQRKI
jgi:hypothetical protein